MQLGLAAMVDGGEDTLTQPALAGAAPAKPSNSGADIFVDISASSGSGASRSGMSEVSLLPAALTAFALKVSPWLCNLTLNCSISLEELD